MGLRSVLMMRSLGAAETRPTNAVGSDHFDLQDLSSGQTGFHKTLGAS